MPWPFNSPPEKAPCKRTIAVSHAHNRAQDGAYAWEPARCGCAGAGAARADLVGAVVVKFPAALAPAHELAEAVELPIGDVHLRGRQRVSLQLHLIVVAVDIHLAYLKPTSSPGV
jgi:hypothetical protein